MPHKTGKHDKSELLSLKNVGPAISEDFKKLGIHTISELAHACPDELYVCLQNITNTSHDPCVWDVFASAIHEAHTGEKHNWWEWTKVRKKREKEGTFNLKK